MTDRQDQYQRSRPRQPLSKQGGQDSDRHAEGNIIRVSANRNTRFWIFLAKIYLKRFGDVEIQGFGDAISGCVRVCENLERFGYATFTKVNTVTVPVVVTVQAEIQVSRRHEETEASQVRSEDGEDPGL